MLLKAIKSTFITSCTFMQYFYHMTTLQKSSKIKLYNAIFFPRIAHNHLITQLQMQMFYLEACPKCHQEPVVHSVRVLYNIYRKCTTVNNRQILSKCQILKRWSHTKKKIIMFLQLTMCQTDNLNDLRKPVGLQWFC